MSAQICVDTDIALCFIFCSLFVIDICVNFYCVSAMALPQVFNRTLNQFHFLAGV